MNQKQIIVFLDLFHWHATFCENSLFQNTKNVVERIRLIKQNKVQFSLCIAVIVTYC